MTRFFLIQNTKLFHRTLLYQSKNSFIYSNYFLIIFGTTAVWCLFFSDEMECEGTISAIATSLEKRRMIFSSAWIFYVIQIVEKGISDFYATSLSLVLRPNKKCWCFLLQVKNAETIKINLRRIKSSLDQVFGKGLDLL